MSSAFVLAATAVAPVELDYYLTNRERYNDLSLDLVVVALIRSSDAARCQRQGSATIVWTESACSEES